MDQPRPKKLLDQVQDVITLKHYSHSTGQTYAHWIKRFILFHHKRHPKEMGVEEIQAFITYLATERTLSASSQNQALTPSAIVSPLTFSKTVTTSVPFKSRSATKM